MHDRKKTQSNEKALTKTNQTNKCKQSFQNRWKII